MSVCGILGVTESKAGSTRAQRAPTREGAASRRWVPGCCLGAGPQPGWPPRWPSWAPAGSPSEPGRPLLEIPHPRLCEWKRKPKCTRDLRALSRRPSVVMGGGGSFLPQGRRGLLSFLLGAPHPFPISPLCWGGGQCRPPAVDSADVSGSDTSG